jgi:hypothetical protein
MVALLLGAGLGLIPPDARAFTYATLLGAIIVTSQSTGTPIP